VSSLLQELNNEENLTTTINQNEEKKKAEKAEIYDSLGKHTKKVGSEVTEEEEEEEEEEDEDEEEEPAPFKLLEQEQQPEHVLKKSSWMAKFYRVNIRISKSLSQ
jgi:hypothetical protein